MVKFLNLLLLFPLAWAETADKADLKERLIESIPEVKSQHRACQQERDQASEPLKFNMGDCLWNGSGNKIPRLSPDIRQKVMNQLSASQKENQETPQYEGLPLFSSPTKKKKDEAMAKLTDYLTERLHQLIFDDKDSKGKIRTARDHKIWYELYKSQIGRDIINVTSSFCLQSEGLPIYKKQNGHGPCQLSSDLWFNHKAGDSKVRQQNMGDLVKPLGGGGEKEETKTKGHRHFIQCLTNLPLICAQEDSYQKDAEKANAYTEESCDSENSVHKKVSANTYNRACVLIKFLKSSKQALIHLRAIDRGWKRLSKEPSQHFALTTSQGTPQESTQRADFKRDQAINIASGEIAEAKIQDGKQSKEFKEVVKEEKDLLEKCAREYSSMKETCDSYLLGEEENFELLDEYALKKYAMSAKISRDLSNDTQGTHLRKILKEDGVSEEKIEKIMGLDEAEVEALKNKIARRYERERDALIKSVQEKFNQKTLRKEEKTNPDQVRTTFKQLAQETSQRPEHYTQTIHYANVVSAYLELRDGDKAVGKNTAALDAELKKSAFDTSDRLEALKELRRKMPSSSSTGPSQENYETGGLSVETINTILNYLPEAK